MVRNMLLVGLGGGVGSALRYLSVHYTHRLFTKNFPLGTLLVNVLGCFLVGILFNLLAKYMPDERLRLLLTVGFCGGFTTFSAFAFENMSMMQSGNYTGLLAYTALSIITGFAAVWLGMAVKI